MCAIFARQRVGGGGSLDVVGSSEPWNSAFGRHVAQDGVACRAGVEGWDSLSLLLSSLELSDTKVYEPEKGGGSLDVVDEVLEEVHVPPVPAHHPSTSDAQKETRTFDAGKKVLKSGVNPGKAIFLSSAGYELSYTNALILLVRSMCVVQFVASEWMKNSFSRMRAHPSATGRARRER